MVKRDFYMHLLIHSMWNGEISTPLQNPDRFSTARVARASSSPRKTR